MTHQADFESLIQKAVARLVDLKLEYRKDERDASQFSLQFSLDEIEALKRDGANIPDFEKVDFRGWLETSALEDLAGTVVKGVSHVPPGEAWIGDGQDVISTVKAYSLHL